MGEKKTDYPSQRIGKNRFYSGQDPERLKEIKELLQDKHINIEGVRKILDTTGCWEVKSARRNNEIPVPSTLSASVSKFLSRRTLA